MEQLQQNPAEVVASVAEAPQSAVPPKPKKKRKKRIRRIIALVLVAAIAFGGYKFFGKKDEGEKQVVTDVVHYDAITAKVEGSGLTKAKNSETITLTTAGTVLDVFVTEGQVVEVGDPLFTVDSPGAQAAVQKARSNVEGYQKQLSAALKDINSLTLTAPYAGKLIDTKDLTVGEEFSGGSVATLVDDTQMRLEQYYSYAYEGEIYAGQSVDVSIPALMSTVQGTVEKVYMVNYVTPEGFKFFRADIVVPNPGALAKDMEAAATISLGGETIYPYESGKLDYYRTTALNISGSGTVYSTALVDYLPVAAGQLLVQISGDDSEAKIFTIQQSLEEAQKELESAEKNLANCSAVAPISGKIIGLSLMPGAEIPANTAALTISDTTTITVNATVDERNISYIKTGTMVDLDQWGNMTFGTVESVSLSSTINNGVATYPIVISADNFDEMIQVNSYIRYSLTASQNDNCLVLPVQCVRTVGLEDGSSATVVYVESAERPENAVEVPFVDEEIPEGYWPVPVEIGIQDTYNVEIKSGVEEGTTVFTQIMTDNFWG